MSKIIMLRAASRRRQPLLKGSSQGCSGTQFGEAVGGAAAVCCCFPCGLANFMYLAVYKLPVSLCRRALQNKKQQRRRQILAESREVASPVARHRRGCEDIGAKVHPSFDDEKVLKEVKGEKLEKEEDDKEVLELEKEMWEIFYGTGFWRSCSQREGSSSSSSSLSSPFSSFSSSTSSSPPQ